MVFVFIRATHRDKLLYLLLVVETKIEFIYLKSVI